MKKVIQVGGTVRSGTTLLGLVLANEENAIALGEVIHLFKPTKEIHSKEINRLKEDPIWSKILNDKPRNLYCNLFKYFPELHLITDSSKDPFWFKQFDTIKSHYRIERIVSYKSPSALKDSFNKRGLDNWDRVYKNYYKRFLSIIPEFRSVKIDILLNDPSTIDKLEQLYKLEKNNYRLNYWNRGQPNFFGSSTIKKNRIDHKKIVSEVVINPDLKLIYKFLESVDISNSKRIKVNTKNLEYSRLTIMLLRIKDLLNQMF